MSTPDSPINRRLLLDILVNIVPIGILLFFTLLFLVSGPLPNDPLIITIQMSLILIPALVVIVVTYYAAKAVTRDERAGGAEIPPGYSQADAKVIAENDDD
jgi:amino acid transporter